MEKWMGKRVKCDECEYDFTLAIDSRVLSRHVSTISEGEEFEVKCPSCGNPIIFNA